MKSVSNWIVTSKYFYFSKACSMGLSISSIVNILNMKFVSLQVLAKDLGFWEDTRCGDDILADCFPALAHWCPLKGAPIARFANRTSNINNQTSWNLHFPGNLTTIEATEAIELLEALEGAKLWEGVVDCRLDIRCYGIFGQIDV